MELALDRPEGYLFVRSVGERGITLIDRELDDSFLLAPDQVIEHWPVHEVAALDAGHVDALLALRPEVLLLGTGQRQAFPAAAFMAGVLRKGIGVEAMDNAAAARTYNLLAGEGRRVVVGFVLPG